MFQKGPFLPKITVFSGFFSKWNWGVAPPPLIIIHTSWNLGIVAHCTNWLYVKAIRWWDSALVTPTFSICDKLGFQKLILSQNISISTQIADMDQGEMTNFDPWKQCQNFICASLGGDDVPLWDSRRPNSENERVDRRGSDTRRLPAAYMRRARPIWVLDPHIWAQAWFLGRREEVRRGLKCLGELRTSQFSPLFTADWSWW